jgi:type VI secretion system protein ImpJ
MKPFWPRTLQLMPVHLQARDAYVEDLLQERTESLAPSRYGVISFKTDDAAWQRGVIAFKSLAVLFPSGLLVTIREPLVRDGSSLPRGATSVFLAVPRLVFRGPNVAPEGSPPGAVRFVVRERPEAPSLNGQIQILFKGERTEDMEVVGLGRVERNGSRLQWQAGAVPTLVRIRGSPLLQSGLERLVSALEERKRELLQLRANHPFRIADAVVAELPGLHLLALIQRYLPRLREQAARPSVPPRELYGLLVALHGSLTAAGLEERSVPPYEHERLGESLPRLFREIETLVDELARDRTTALPFERVDASTFRLTFDRAALVGKRPFLVASGADESFLRDRIPSLLKMGSPAAMPSLLQSALRGVSVAVEFEPAHSIPRRPDTVTYRLDVRDPLWLDIEDRRTVLLYVPQAAPTLSFTLYGVELAV